MFQANPTSCSLCYIAIANKQTLSHIEAVMKVAEEPKKKRKHPYKKPVILEELMCSDEEGEDDSLCC